MARRCLQIEMSSRTTKPLYENVRAFYFALWCSQIVMSSYTKKHFNKLRGPLAFAFYFKDGIIFTRYMNLTSNRNYTINASLTQATMPSTVPTKRAWTIGGLGDSRNFNVNQDDGTSVFTFRNEFFHYRPFTQKFRFSLSFTSKRASCIWFKITKSTHTSWNQATVSSTASWYYRRPWRRVWDFQAFKRKPGSRHLGVHISKWMHTTDPCTLFLSWKRYRYWKSPSFGKKINVGLKDAIIISPTKQCNIMDRGKLNHILDQIHECNHLQRLLSEWHTSADKRERERDLVYSTRTRYDRVSIMFQFNEGELNFSYSWNHIFNPEGWFHNNRIFGSWNTELNKQSFPTYEPSLRR